VDGDTPAEGKALILPSAAKQRYVQYCDNLKRLRISNLVWVLEMFSIARPVSERVKDRAESMPASMRRIDLPSRQTPDRRRGLFSTWYTVQYTTVYSVRSPAFTIAEKLPRIGTAAGRDTNNTAAGLSLALYLVSHLGTVGWHGRLFVGPGAWGRGRGA